MDDKIAVVEFGGSGVKMTVFEFDMDQRGYVEKYKIDEKEDSNGKRTGGKEPQTEVIKQINGKLNTSEISHYEVIVSSGFMEKYKKFLGLQDDDKTHQSVSDEIKKKEDFIDAYKKISGREDINKKMKNVEQELKSLKGTLKFLETFKEMITFITELKPREEKRQEIEGNPVYTTDFKELTHDKITDSIEQFAKFEGQNEVDSYHKESHFGSKAYNYLSMGSTTVQYCSFSDGETAKFINNFKLVNLETLENVIKVLLLKTTIPDKLTNSEKTGLTELLNSEQLQLLSEPPVGPLVLAGNFTASIFHPNPTDPIQSKIGHQLKTLLKGKNVLIQKNDKMGSMQGANNEREGFTLIKIKAQELEFIPADAANAEVILTKTNANKDDKFNKISFSEGIKLKLQEQIPEIQNMFEGHVKRAKQALKEAAAAEPAAKPAAGGGKRSRRRRRSKRNKTRKNRNKSKPKSRKKNSKGRKSKRSRR